MIKLTKHALMRAKERFNWTRKMLNDKALLSLEEGIFVPFDEVLKVMFNNNIKREGSMLYYNEGVIFIFDDNILITVYAITGHGTTKGERSEKSY